MKYQIYLCPHCIIPLKRSKLPQYSFECLNCGERFFECDAIPEECVAIPEECDAIPEETGKRIQKAKRLQYIKHLCISSLMIIIFAIGTGWYPYIKYYQDEVYEADRAQYYAEKSQWDSIQTINFKKTEDSAFNYWIAHNDTSLKQIKKISKELTYGTTGYYKKTGKLKCVPPSTYSNELVCEPMEKWVTTGYYVDGYYYDTTWTDGYNNRDEWLTKARKIAHGEAIKQKVDFRPYDGHDREYIIKSESPLDTFSVVCTWLCGMALLYGLAYFLVTIICIITRREPDYTYILNWAVCGLIMCLSWLILLKIT